MIFVTVGTQRQPFTRLFNELVRLVDDNQLQDEIVCQTGTYELNHHKIKSFNYLPYSEMVDYIKNADIIISHGGTGSILPPIKNNKKVIGIPRLQMYGEHLNDHQKDLIDTLSEKNMIISVYDVKDLQSAIERIKDFEPNSFNSGRDIIIEDIRNFINK